MAEVFAGFVVGFAFSIIVAPIGAIMLVRSSRETGMAQRFAPEGTNVVALAMVVHFGAFLVLTAVGMVMGLALHGIEARRPDGGLGSPNLVYTVLVLALVAALVVPMLLAPWRRFAVGAAMLAVLLFGWAVPWLAQAG
ncbi:MAG: hypothetical protein HY873_01790 [Chloroflexi bacterium]|nr:hypothetical protein [Chloroflexota bacterium]